MKRDYKISDYRQSGIALKRIRMSKGIHSIDLRWTPSDLEAEARNTRSADMFIKKHGLNYNTKKIK